MKFLEGKPLAGQTDDNTVDISKIVIDLRFRDPLGQFAGDAVDLASQVVPNRAHLGVTLANIDADDRDSGPGFTADKIQFRQFLDHLFNGRRYQGLDPLCSGPREIGHHLGRTNNKTGVISPGHIVECLQAGDDHHNKDHPGDPVVFNGPAGKCHPGVPCSSRTTRPSCSLLMPAVIR